MRLCSAIALVGGLLLMSPALAEDGIQLEVKGTVKTGLFAIGGETTGVVISTKGGFGCELDGANDEKYDGKTCVVTGTFTVRRGVEVRQRAILKVNKIEVAEKADDNFVKATVTGEVKTGVAAPGGQTTGVTITAGGTTWELDASKNKDAAAALEKLNGKKAVVVGTVEVITPMAAPPRPRTVVTVTEVKAVEK